MGEMVMKDLFSKENFLFPEFDKTQRRQSLIVAGILGLLFVMASFCFLNWLYCFANIVGSIVSGSVDVMVKDFGRSVPMLLSLLMTIWAMLLVHGIFRNVSDERRMRSLRKDSIVIIAMGGVNVVYIVSGLIAGTYISMIEGSPSPLFPLDAMLYSLFFVCLGVLGLVYAAKLSQKAPYLVPSRGPIVTRGRFGYCLVITLWMLVALFCFAGFWTGLFIIDFIHGYAAYSIALLVVYCLNAFYFIVWEFYYNEVKAERRKVVLMPMAIIGLIVAVIVAIFYFVALSFNLDGPSNVGFGVLPVAFAASVNIATMLVVATPIIVSFVALMKGIRLRRIK